MPLTWQNVAAPDFSGAASAFGQFSNILGSALGSLRTGVGGFDQAKSDLINNQIALALAQQPNTTAAQAAITGGKIGGIDLTDPNVVRRLSAANLTAMGPEAMARLSSDQTSAAKAASDFSQNQAMDAQAPLIAQARSARANNDLPTALALEKQIDWSKTGFRNAEDFYTNGQRVDSNRTSNDSAAFGLSKDKQAYADTRQAADVGAAIAQAAGSAADVDTQLASYDGTNGKPKLSGTVYKMARERALELLNAASGGGGGPGGSGGPDASGAGFAGPTAGNPGAIGGYDTVFGNGKFAAPEKPLTGMTLGEVQDFQKNSLIPATRGKVGAGPDKGTGAVGAFQITYDTLQRYAPKVFGANWQNVAFTPQNQEKLGEAIWNDVKGGDLHQIWQSLPSNAPGAYKDKSWSDVRSMIAQHEVGVSPDELATGGAIVNTALQNQTMQTLANSGIPGFAKAFNDTSNVQDVAKALKGTFSDKNVDEGRLVHDIQRIQAMGEKEGVQLSPAIAGEILKNSTSGQGILGRFFANNLGAENNLGNGQGVNYDKVSDYINQYKTGKIHSDAATYARIQAAQGPMLLAQQQYQQALQVYNAELQASRMKPNYDMNQLQRAQARLAAASQGLKQAQLAAAQVSEQKYFGQSPQPAPTKPTGPAPASVGSQVIPTAVSGAMPVVGPALMAARLLSQFAQ